MSRVYITASSDTSIYERYANLNTGQDEILEVGKKQDKLEIVNGQVRSLIKFTLTDLVGAPTTSNAYLNLKVANATKLNQNQLVYVYPASRSWEEGSGYFEQSPIKSDDGSTWTTYASGSNWTTAGGDYNLTPVVSASVVDIVNDELRINVTDVVQSMYSGSVDDFTDATCDTNHTSNTTTVAHDANASIVAGLSVSGTGIPSNTTISSITDSTHFVISNAATATNSNVTLTFGKALTSNYGLLLTYSGSSATNIKNVGNIKVFSRQTHTVHAPTLELAWSNQSFATGSLKTLTSLDIEIAPKNMKADYKAGEVAKMRFTVRDRYPAKTFANTRRFDNRYYLPSGSIYTIVDAGSGTTIVPFDAYSHIDCDVTGSYVMLDTKPLYKNRFYELSLKVTLSSEVYFSRPFRFKVV